MSQVHTSVLLKHPRRSASARSCACIISYEICQPKSVNVVEDNKYINSSNQKGGLPEISGGLKHTSVISQVIQEAETLGPNSTFLIVSHDDRIYLLVIFYFRGTH